jgi:3-dehydroquinate synthase
MSQDHFEVNVRLKERGYQVLIGERISEELSGRLTELGLNKQIALISTAPVSNLYLEKLRRQFGGDWNFMHYDVPDGEKSKSHEQAYALYTWLLENKYERNCTILALGGGVVGDLAGFVAATYLRGVNLVQLPTTLLAQVDSSIGGKVGINHPLGKNLIGSFYQPRLVLADISFLQSLPDEEYVCGLGEVIKYGVLSDSDLFFRLEDNIAAIREKDPALLATVVQACVQIKADIVEKDEREQGIRAYLNLGHTFAHALETFYKYHDLKHGQAVLLGMKCALFVSGELGLIDRTTAARIDGLINGINVQLPAEPEMDVQSLVEIMKRDKKIRDGTIYLVLPAGIGKIVLTPVADENLLRESFSGLR